MVLTLCRPRHVLFAIGATINLLSPHPVFSPLLNPIQGPAQIMPHFYYKIFFYYKTISMSFCNITILHSSAPYDILGEMFKLLSISCETFTYPTHHIQALFLPDPVQLEYSRDLVLEKEVGYLGQPITSGFISSHTKYKGLLILWLVQ